MPLNTFRSISYNLGAGVTQAQDIFIGESFQYVAIASSDITISLEINDPIVELKPGQNFNGAVPVNSTRIKLILYNQSSDLKNGKIRVSFSSIPITSDITGDDNYGGNKASHVHITRTADEAIDHSQNIWLFANQNTSLSDRIDDTQMNVALSHGLFWDNSSLNLTWAYAPLRINESGRLLVDSEPMFGPDQATKIATAIVASTLPTLIATAIASGTLDTEIANAIVASTLPTLIATAIASGTLDTEIANAIKSSRYITNIANRKTYTSATINTPIAIINNRLTRQRFKIINRSINEISIGMSAGVFDGFQSTLKTGESIELDNYTGFIYASCSVASQELQYWETY